MTIEVTMPAKRTRLESTGVWVEVAKITASDGMAGDEFGISLALKGRTAVFGAVGSNARGDDSARRTCSNVWRASGHDWPD